MIEGSKGTKQREAYRMKIEELQRKEISEGLCQTAQYQNIGCLGAKHHAAPITCTVIKHPVGWCMRLSLFFFGK
jgi:hypothetical protein